MSEDQHHPLWVVDFGLSLSWFGVWPVGCALVKAVDECTSGLCVCETVWVSVVIPVFGGVVLGRGMFDSTWCAVVTLGWSAGDMVCVGDAALDGGFVR